MTSTFHLGDFMVDGDIYQDRKYTGGGRTYLESGWMMEMSFFFSNMLFLRHLAHMFFAQELIEYLSAWY